MPLICKKNYFNRKFRPHILNFFNRYEIRKEICHVKYTTNCTYFVQIKTNIYMQSGSYYVIYDFVLPAIQTKLHDI